MNKNFWVMLTLFVALTVFYFTDHYFLHIFEVEDRYTGQKIHTFQMVYGLYGLAFSMYVIHLHGFLEGEKEGYERGLENGKKTKSDTT